MVNEYPERKPNLGNIDRFTFSLANVDSAEQDLTLQVQAYEDRIQKLVDHATVQEIPILKHILGLTHDEDELTLLGTALLRVAPLVKTYDELSEKRNLLKVARENPSWVAWAFGDFESDFDISKL